MGAAKRTWQACQEAVHEAPERLVMVAALFVAAALPLSVHAAADAGVPKKPDAG
jgi:hypothetical protein